jgi:hypothetical protein
MAMKETQRDEEWSRPGNDLGTLLGAFERPASLAAEHAFLEAVGRLRDGPPEKQEELAREVIDAALLWALEVTAGIQDPCLD